MTSPGWAPCATAARPCRRNGSMRMIVTSLLVSASMLHTPPTLDKAQRPDVSSGRDVASARADRSRPVLKGGPHAAHHPDRRRGRSDRRLRPGPVRPGSAGAAADLEAGPARDDGGLTAGA